MAQLSGLGSVIGVVNDDEHHLAIIAGQSVENIKKLSAQGKQNATPIYNMRQEPHVQIVAAQLRSCLDDAQTCI